MRLTRRFALFAAVLLLAISQVSVYALSLDFPPSSSSEVQQTGFSPVDRTLPLVVDEAGLLTDREVENLIDLLERLSEENKCEIAVVTVYSLGGKSAMDYADDFYDYNGYGYGPNDDGILLLLSMEYRDYWVTTYGTAYEQLTEERFEWLLADVLPLLSNGDYYRAFERFAYNSAELMQMDKPSNIYYPPEPLPPRKWVTAAGFAKWSLISLVSGMVIAAIANSSAKSKHKSVRFSSGAQPYLQQARTAGAQSQVPQIAGQLANQFPNAPVVAGGIALVGLASALLLRNQSDVFIRTSTSRTEKASSSSGSSSSGGYGGHTSSSGRTHGGGGGKF
ncbi:MAG: TPM domain-containing protein [Coriobacteriia bacterium]|nr:TPM domain-containing protein [Coriobacteriia bacterium]